MKKVVVTILWIFCSFIVGIVVFAVFGYVMVQSSPNPTNPASLDDYKVRLIMVVDWLFPIGLPIIALILGICGVLPGTRSKKPPLGDCEQPKRSS